MTVTSTRRDRMPAAGPSLTAAIDAFVDTLDNPGTARNYGGTLRALVRELGADAPVASLAGVATDVRSWFERRWANAAPATWNRNLCSPGPTLACGTRPCGADVADLNMAIHQSRVQRKGGAADITVWQAGTARLLPRLREGRKTGPLFLTERRARLALPSADLDAASGGRARLSYRRAAQVFEEASAGWTLHQLRHSALTHAAEAGANTSTLLACSGHTLVTSLARYARVSPEALAR